MPSPVCCGFALPFFFPAKVYCFFTCLPITAGASKTMRQNVHFPPLGPSHQFCYFDKKLKQGHYQHSPVYRILAESRSTVHCFNRFLCYEAQPFRHLRTKMCCIYPMFLSIVMLALKNTLPSGINSSRVMSLRTVLAM